MCYMLLVILETGESAVCENEFFNNNATYLGSSHTWTGIIQELYKREVHVSTISTEAVPV